MALAGLAAIAIHKIAFTGFKTGPGIAGFVSHLGHEWVILANLLCLLMGFALLSRHFEKSHVPVVLPKFLPHDWKGGFVLLVMVWVLSSFLDNIAGALIGGAMAHQLFRAKVHIGFLAAIVAASNAGGAWSVLGDTTTTMMWIAGVSPGRVFEAIIGAAIALFIFGIPAAIQQHRYSPICHAHEHTHVDWMRVGIVGLILVFAVTTNVIVNTKFAALRRSFSFSRRDGVDGNYAICGNTPPGLGSVAGGIQGFCLFARARFVCVHDAGGAFAFPVLANRTRSRLSLFRV